MGTAQRLKGDPKGFPCVSVDWPDLLDETCQEAADVAETAFWRVGGLSEIELAGQVGALHAQVKILLGMIDSLRHRCSELAIELSTRPCKPGPDEAIAYVQELSTTRLARERIVPGNADVGETKPFVTVDVPGHYEIEGLRRRILAEDQWGDEADPMRFAVVPTYDAQADVLTFWLEDV